MKKRHVLKKAILRLFTVLFCTVTALGAFFGIKGYAVYRGAVSEASLGERIEAVRGGEHFTRFSDLSDFYINAVISVEDHRFEEHFGIDLIAIGRAAWADLKARSWVEGGSTITQQVSKNLLFTQEKKIERKVAECFAALALESAYSKSEIFELYVNTAYFGSGYYGIYDAAMGYFGKPPAKLSDYEAAMLAGLPNAPSAYSPDTNMELAAKRVSQVLQSMVTNELLTQEEMDSIENDRFEITRSFPKQEPVTAKALPKGEGFLYPSMT